MTDPTQNDIAEDTADDLAADDAPFTIEEAELAALELDVDVDEFADELQEAAAPAAVEPPGEAPTFFNAGSDLSALDGLILTDRVPVLERLGPAHFRSKGFSFMGFLQTVYDHVATEMKPATPAPVTDEADHADDAI